MPTLDVRDTSFGIGVEAMKLIIKHTGESRGEKLYTVTDGFESLFSGTIDEVKRFVLIHNRKVRERREAAESVIRALRAG